ncbi:MAG: hypothetical protein VYD54_00845, partial [Bdellovibrionota bacterium]|nr:hypothetical protein [Bdellovibrionota bacterium]
KVILAKTKNIKTVLVLRIDERKKQLLNDKDYLLLLTELLNRFVRESKEGPDPSLPPLPKINEIVTKNFKAFRDIIENSFDDLKVAENKKKEKEFIEKSIFNIEGIFRSVLKKELTQAKALPVEKKNKKFIKFIKDYLPKWPST